MQNKFCPPVSFCSNNPKVSVIVPIYNKEKFLPKSLNSLANQTLEDIEIICVNDGSKDNSLKVINDFAQKDSRFVVINQENKGTGISRNNGLKAAKGEYIVFLDPDDWFEKNAFKELYQKATLNNLDICTFNHTDRDIDGNLLRERDIPSRTKGVLDISEHNVFSGRDLKQKVLGGLSNCVWNKFYNRNFLKDNKVYFPNCCIGEDGVFTLKALLGAKRIGFIDKYFYNYTKYLGSALRSQSNKNFEIFKAWDAMQKVLKEYNSPALIEEFNNFIATYIFQILHSIKSKDKFLETCQKRLSIAQWDKIEFKMNMLKNILNNLAR